MGKARVRFCKKCSGVKPKDLKGVLEKGEWKEGCVHACSRRRSDPGCAFARIDGELVVCSSKKKLVKRVREAVA